MEKLTFTIDGHSFSTAFNTAIDREHCIEEILSTTGKRYDWFREITGRKNWILYDTEQYEVKDFDSFELVVLDNRFDGVKEFLHVKEGFTGKLHLPINSSACSFLFTSTDVTKLDFTEFDTSEIVDMSYMFVKADLGNSFSPVFNTSKVIDMNNMFKFCYVKHLDLHNLDVSSVSDFSNMFLRCSSLMDINLANWNTSNAEDFYSMFNSCRALTQLNVSHFKTSKVTDMTNMFASCSKLKELNLNGWDFSKVFNADSMFAWCDILKRIVANFNFKVVNDISSIARIASSYKMFTGCINLPNYKSYKTKKNNAHYGKGGYLTLKR